jgi:hypothetical protein
VNARTLSQWVSSPPQPVGGFTPRKFATAALAFFGPNSYGRNLAADFVGEPVTSQRCGSGAEGGEIWRDVAFVFSQHQGPADPISLVLTILFNFNSRYIPINSLSFRRCCGGVVHFCSGTYILLIHPCPIISYLIPCLGYFFCLLLPDQAFQKISYNFNAGI